MPHRREILDEHLSYFVLHDMSSADHAHADGATLIAGPQTLRGLRAYCEKALGAPAKRQP